jgi:small subunit ribosomal protein S6
MERIAGMSHYESMVLVKSSLSDEEVNGSVEKIRGRIERLGGRVAQAVNWGKKKLAYEIDREKKAVYLIFRFDADGTVANELDRACRLDEQIVRIMTVEIEPDAAVPVAAAPPSVGVAPAPEAHD